MNVLVIGGSKGIGHHVVKQALAAGHTVTAFSRNIKDLGITNGKLRLAAGNVLSPEAITESMAGQDIVICTLGLPTLKAIGLPFAKRSYVLSEGTKNILAAMDVRGVKRLICVTAIGTNESTKQLTSFARLVLRRGLRWLFIEKDRQETLIRNSNVAWTLIRPTALTNGKKRGAKIGEKLQSGILTQVSRADVASAIVKLIDQPDSNKKALVISYDARLGDSIRWVRGYFGFG